MPSANVKPVWTANPIPAGHQYINSVGISGNGKLVIGGTYYHDYTANANHTVAQPTFTVGVFVWNAQGKLQWQDQFSATEGVYWVGLSRDGSWAAAGGLLGHANGFVYIYNAGSGAKALSYTTNARVNMVALSGDGSYLVAGATDLYFFKRNGATWSTPQVIPGVTGDSIIAVGVSDDGQWICAGTLQGRVILIQNSNGTLSAPVIWQQPGGTIHWIAMAQDGSNFVASGNASKIFAFNSSGFKKSRSPAWEATLANCTRCGSVSISGNGQFVSAVGNNGNAGKIFLFANKGNAAQALWNAATSQNPNSTSLDAAAKFVTVADGYPDGTPGDFYLYDNTGKLQWSFKTKNMSWPMQISSDGTGIAAGSDDGSVYYFS